MVGQPAISKPGRETSAKKAMKLAQIINALRAGAVLHHSLVKGPHWELHAGDIVVTVSTRAVQALLKRGAIVPAGDSLFPNIPSQTWRSAP
jgi:hypothetical protein